MSEIHKIFLADNLTRRLGVGWESRERDTHRNPAFEISSIPDELISEFSAGTEQIEANLAALSKIGTHTSRTPPAARCTSCANRRAS